MSNYYRCQKPLVRPPIWDMSLLLSLETTLCSTGIVTLHPQFLFVHFFNNNSYLLPESQKCFVWTDEIGLLLIVFCEIFLFGGERPIIVVVAIFDISWDIETGDLTL